MLTWPGEKVPTWSPAMKLPCDLVMRWISYWGCDPQPQISLGKSCIRVRMACWGCGGMTFTTRGVGVRTAYGGLVRLWALDTARGEVGEASARSARGLIRNRDHLLLDAAGR